MKSSSAIIPRRKSPRGHGQKNSGQDDWDYNEEGEDMVSQEEGKEEKVIKIEDVAGKKWKREKGTGEERVSS